MGSEATRDRRSQERERPEHEVTLPEFYIARYPVTVAQFAAFVKDSGREPADKDSVRAAANAPVVQISWHEALAYCAWLTEKLRNCSEAPEAIGKWLDGTIREGWQVALPSEAEWEKAARGTDGRIYPWSDDFDPGCGNFHETGIGRVSAVGAFPEGTSPCGALDMSGNVWEWTRSLWGTKFETPDFGYPYQPDDPKREDLRAPDSVLRVVRGGSFDLNDHLARAAYRSRLLPPGSLGFRVVVSRSPRRRDSGPDARAARLAHRAGAPSRPANRTGREHPRPQLGEPRAVRELDWAAEGGASGRGPTRRRPVCP
jgi:formylglycine-generating enzyme required for sulfatase activity